MKVAINIEYKGKDYTSDYSEMNKSDFEKLEEIAKKAASGSLDFISFNQENKKIVVAKKILLKSVISLVTKNE